MLVELVCFDLCVWYSCTHKIIPVSLVLQRIPNLAALLSSASQVLISLRTITAIVGIVIIVQESFFDVEIEICFTPEPKTIRGRIERAVKLASKRNI